MKKIMMLAVLAGSASVALADNYGPGSVGAIADATASNTQAGSGLTTFTFNAVNVANPTITSFDSLVMSLSHTWVGDLLIQITSPAGTTADVLVRAGVVSATGFGSSGDFLAANTITFVDSGGSAFPIAGNVATGTYNRLGRANPLQVASDTGLGFNAFVGENLNGVWTLSFRDYGGGDVGTLGSWSMNITSTPTPGAAAILGLGGLVAGRRRRA